MERAIDGDDVALSDKFLELVDTASTEKLLESGIKGLLN